MRTCPTQYYSIYLICRPLCGQNHFLWTLPFQYCRQGTVLNTKRIFCARLVRKGSAGGSYNPRVIIEPKEDGRLCVCLTDFRFIWRWFFVIRRASKNEKPLVQVLGYWAPKLMDFIGLEWHLHYWHFRRTPKTIYFRGFMHIISWRCSNSPKTRKGSSSTHKLLKWIWRSNGF